MPRTHVVNREAFEQLRAKKGLSIDELMRKCGLSHGPFDNIRAGKGVYIETVNALAKAFGVEPGELQVEPKPVEGKRKVLRVELDGKLSYEELQQRLEKAEKLAGTTYDIEVVLKMDGSTIVHLDMDERDAEKFLAAFTDKKFAELGVTEVREATPEEIAEMEVDNGMEKDASAARVERLLDRQRLSKARREPSSSDAATDSPDHEDNLDVVLTSFALTRNFMRRVGASAGERVKDAIDLLPESDRPVARMAMEGEPLTRIAQAANIPDADVEDIAIRVLLKLHKLIFQSPGGKSSGHPIFERKYPPQE